MKDYFDKIMRLPVTSELAMQKILLFPSFIVKKCTWKYLRNLNIKCHFFYGESDFMEKLAADELIKSNTIKGTYNIVKDAGHLVVNDNPEEVYKIFKKNKII